MCKMKRLSVSERKKYFVEVASKKNSHQLDNLWETLHPSWRLYSGFGNWNYGGQSWTIFYLTNGYEIVGIQLILAGEVR